jgi:hypothetical protein
LTSYFFTQISADGKSKLEGRGAKFDFLSPFPLLFSPFVFYSSAIICPQSCNHLRVRTNTATPASLARYAFWKLNPFSLNASFFLQPGSLKDGAGRLWGAGFFYSS